MDKLTSFYALSKDASEDSLLDAAKAERQKLTEATEEVQNLKLELEAKTKELKEFQNEAIKGAVKNAIDSGKFDKEDEAQLIENAEKIGLEAFNLMVSKIKIPHVDVAGMIDKKKVEGKKAGEFQKVVDGKVVDKVYEDFTALEIEKLQTLNPEKFESIMKEFNERD